MYLSIIILLVLALVSCQAENPQYNSINPAEIVSSPSDSPMVELIDPEGRYTIDLPANWSDYRIMMMSGSGMRSFLDIELPTSELGGDDGYATVLTLISLPETDWNESLKTCETLKNTSYTLADLSDNWCDGINFSVIGSASGFIIGMIPVQDIPGDIQGYFQSMHEGGATGIHHSDIIDYMRDNFNEL